MTLTQPTPDHHVRPGAPFRHMPGFSDARPDRAASVPPTSADHLYLPPGTIAGAGLVYPPPDPNALFVNAMPLVPVPASASALVHAPCPAPLSAPPSFAPDFTNNGLYQPSTPTPACSSSIQHDSNQSLQRDQNHSFNIHQHPTLTPEQGHFSPAPNSTYPPFNLHAMSVPVAAYTVNQVCSMPAGSLSAGAGAHHPVSVSMGSMSMPVIVPPVHFGLQPMTNQEQAQFAAQMPLLESQFHIPNPPTPAFYNTNNSNISHNAPFGTQNPPQQFLFQPEMYSTLSIPPVPIPALSMPPSDMSVPPPSKRHCLTLGPSTSTSPTTAHPSAMPAPPSSEVENHRTMCPIAGCGRSFKDLRAHMLTHQDERPEKCPISSCEYHVKGFARKYDRNRHTLTHFRGDLVCIFCPDYDNLNANVFSRVDHFKKHLSTEHGVEQAPPNSRKRNSSGRLVGSGNESRATPPTDQTTVASSPLNKVVGTGGDLPKCSTCTLNFNCPQTFYEHLDDCIFTLVQKRSPAEDINEKVMREMDDDPDVRNTLSKHNLLGSANPTSRPSPDSEAESDSLSQTPSSSARSASGNRRTKKDLVRRGACPSSWGASPAKMDTQVRTMSLFNGPERLLKESMILQKAHQVRVLLPDGISTVTDADIQMLSRAEAVHTGTEPAATAVPDIQFDLGLDLGSDLDLSPDLLNVTQAAIPVTSAAITMSSLPMATVPMVSGPLSIPDHSHTTTGPESLGQVMYQNSSPAWPSVALGMESASGGGSGPASAC